MRKKPESSRKLKIGVKPMKIADTIKPKRFTNLSNQQLKDLIKHKKQIQIWNQDDRGRLTELADYTQNFMDESQRNDTIMEYKNIKGQINETIADLDYESEQIASEEFEYQEELNHRMGK
jgi:hypothetical protein